PRHHHGGPFAEAPDIFERTLAHPVVAVLALKDVSYCAAPLVGICDPFLLFLPPGCRHWWPGIKAADSIEMVKVVVKKTRSVGNARKWQALRIHGSGSRSVSRFDSGRSGRIQKSKSKIQSKIRTPRIHWYRLGGKGCSNPVKEQFILSR